MALTAGQEAGLLKMYAQWVAQNDTQAQHLIDTKQTSDGLLKGVDITIVSPGMAVKVADALKTAEVKPL